MDIDEGMRYWMSLAASTYLMGECIYALIARFMLPWNDPLCDRNTVNRTDSRMRHTHTYVHAHTHSSIFNFSQRIYYCDRRFGNIHERLLTRSCIIGVVGKLSGTRDFNVNFFN